jgi:hypothetical protein
MHMRVTLCVASALVVGSGLGVSGCASPQEPVSIAGAVESVALVEVPQPSQGQRLRVTVRVADADGAALELVRCTVALLKRSGSRWESVDVEMCNLPAGREREAIPIVDGMLPLTFAPQTEAGQYTATAGVRRSGRREIIVVRAPFELSAANIP